MLSHRVVALSNTFLLKCLISGLKPHIKGEFQALKPINLMQPVDLAKLEEEIFLEFRKYNQANLFRKYFTHPKSSTSLATSSNTSSTNPPLLPKPLFNCPSEAPIRFEILSASREKAYAIPLTRSLYSGISAKANCFSQFIKMTT